LWAVKIAGSNLPRFSLFKKKRAAGILARDSEKAPIIHFNYRDSLHDNNKETSCSRWHSITPTSSYLHYKDSQQKSNLVFEKKLKK